MRHATLGWARSQMRRAGFDLIRHPSARLRDGHLFHALREFKIDYVLDVGANVGQFARELRDIGYTGHIISIEPVSDVYADLTAAAASDPRWTTVQTALGATKTEATMAVSSASVMSSLRSPRDGRQTGVGEDIRTVRHEVVPVNRLDDLFDDLVPAGARVFLKLAVQGWDLEVLRGAERSLPRVSMLQSLISVIPLYEGMPPWIESLGTYRALGFEPTGFFPVLYYGRFRVVEFDAVMIRPDHLDEGGS